MRAITFNFQLLTFNSFRLPAAIRRQDSSKWREHGSFLPGKNSSTAAATTSSNTLLLLSAADVERKISGNIFSTADLPISFPEKSPWL
jgi:hypothetical protein